MTGVMVAARAWMLAGMMRAYEVRQMSVRGANECQALASEARNAASRTAWRDLSPKPPCFAGRRARRSAASNVGSGAVPKGVGCSP